MLALRLHEPVLLLNTISLNFNNFNVESYDLHQYTSITMLRFLTTLKLINHTIRVTQRYHIRL